MAAPPVHAPRLKLTAHAPPAHSEAASPEVVSALLTSWASLVTASEPTNNSQAANRAAGYQEPPTPFSTAVPATFTCTTPAAVSPHCGWLFSSTSSNKRKAHPACCSKAKQQTCSPACLHQIWCISATQLRASIREVPSPTFRVVCPACLSRAKPNQIRTFRIWL